MILSQDLVKIIREKQQLHFPWSVLNCENSLFFISPPPPPPYKKRVILRTIEGVRTIDALMEESDIS